MAEAIAGATLLVRDNDEAIAYFTGALGFWNLLEPRGGTDG